MVDALNLLLRFGAVEAVSRAVPKLQFASVSVCAEITIGSGTKVHSTNCSDGPNIVSRIITRCSWCIISANSRPFARLRRASIIVHIDVAAASENVR